MLYKFTFSFFVALKKEEEKKSIRNREVYKQKTTKAKIVRKKVIKNNIYYKLLFIYFRNLLKNLHQLYIVF